MKQEEKVIFFYGYLYAKAEEIKNEFNRNESVEDIMRELIEGAMSDLRPKETIMITIDGEQQSCQCGGNVFFKKRKDVVGCNACGLEYQTK